MDDGATAIAYLWTRSENYWPDATGDNDDRDPFTPSAGLDRYEAARARLDHLGLRVPAGAFMQAIAEHNLNEALAR